jgi:exosome complex exonuclease RRP6
VRLTIPNVCRCRYVSDLSALVACSRDLDSSSIIAIDLEHHAQRSFLGIVCLMQLSTPTCDYIIDTLELHDCMHVLQPAFTNPGIVKVCWAPTINVNLNQ